MSGYSSARKLSNVRGRIDYISNEERQENILGFWNTTNTEFWNELAIENQSVFKSSKNDRNGNKCVEAREFIIGLPLDTDVSAQAICEDFKNKYGVECCCAVHYKTSAGKENLHAHLIFSERERLPKPIIQEEKIAPRTYYYDEHGKKCKKADAVKVVPKGTIMQKGITRYFGSKNKYFQTTEFALEYKAHILKKVGIEDQKDYTLCFATKHIGKNNPKAQYIKEWNDFITDELNPYLEEVQEKYVEFKNINAKKRFLELLEKNKTPIIHSKYEISRFKSVYDEFKELYPLEPKVSQNRFQKLSGVYNDLIQEKNNLEFAIQQDFLDKSSAYQLLRNYAFQEKLGIFNPNAPKNILINTKIDQSINQYIDVLNIDIPNISKNTDRNTALDIANKVLLALKNLLNEVISKIESILQELSSDKKSDFLEIEDKEIDEPDITEDW